MILNINVENSQKQFDKDFSVKYYYMSLTGINYIINFEKYIYSFLHGIMATSNDNLILNNLSMKSLSA